jgi:hypothetical protein
VFTRLKDYIVALYLREPARSNAAIVAAVLAVAGAVGVVVSAPIVLGAVTLIAPFVVAELTRPKVTPDVKVEAKVAQAEERAFDEGFDAADSVV